MVICLERGADLHMPSSCHCHSLSLASVKSRLVLPLMYRPTRVVLEKGSLKGCMIQKKRSMSLATAKDLLHCDWLGMTVATPSELSDWQVRNIDIYLYYVYDWQ